MTDNLNIGALREQVIELRNDLKHFAHDVKNLSQIMAAFPSKGELDAKHDSLSARLKQVEDNMNKAAWAIVLSWIAGLGVVGGVATLFRKIM
jgi:hypothetical protein